MKASKEERVKNNYLAAQKAYKGGGSDFFNDPYHVYAELLFEDLCDLELEDPARYEFRQIFSTRLYENLGKSLPLDIDYLSDGIKKAMTSLKRKTYHVYFGIPIKVASGATLPFGKTVKLKGVVFTPLSFSRLLKVHKGDFYNQIEQHAKKHMRYGVDPLTVMRNHQYFKAAVDATDFYNAARIAGEAFDVLWVASTVAQERLSRKYTLGGTKFKSRAPMSPIDLLVCSLASDYSKNELLYSMEVATEADATLEFTKDAKKISRFNKYKLICNGPTTPIDRRTAKVLMEFARALSLTDAHLRQLSLWRCIELAMVSKSKNRSEKELVQIIGNYYAKSPHWLQQGYLVMKQRNLFVHQGLGMDREADRMLNWTQDYASTALALLLWMRDKKIGKSDESEIDDFFDLYTKPGSTFRVAAKMLHARSKLS